MLRIQQSQEKAFPSFLTMEWGKQETKKHDVDNTTFRRDTCYVETPTRVGEEKEGVEGIGVTCILLGASTHFLFFCNQE